MALANLDDADDMENLDFTQCKEKIVQLQAERERRLESTERLQEKLKALNNELAARRLEAEQRKLELQEEQFRNKKLAEKAREEGDQQHGNRQEEDEGKVRQFIEDMVQEKANGGSGKKEKQKSEHGFRVFDETELMVEKPGEDQGVAAQSVDTVLVTHHKPNSDDVHYHLSYRVAKDIPSKKLREDACNYWGLSEVQYILQTIEGSKVHDDVILQHCFKPSERCQLILAPKDPRRQVLMESEMEATRPKAGRGAKREKKVAVNANQDSNKRTNASSFLAWMQAKPGLWDFMVQRDKNVIDHLTRIKFSSIIIYALLAIACMMTLYMVKPPSKAYYARHGVLQAMTVPRVIRSCASVAGSTVNYDCDENQQSVPGFHSIKTQEDAWQWLTYTVSNELMRKDSDLRQHGFLVGWLRLRMQQVGKPKASNCIPSGLAPDNTVCTNAYYEGAKAGAEDLKFLKYYWKGYNSTTTTTTTTTTVTLEALPTTVTTTTVASGGGQSSRRLRRLRGEELLRTQYESNLRDTLEREDSVLYDSMRRVSRSSSEVDETCLYTSATCRSAALARPASLMLGTIFDGKIWKRAAAESSRARKLLFSYDEDSYSDGFDWYSNHDSTSGKAGRSSKVDPWKHKKVGENAVEHAVATLSGIWQTWDPSGYNLDYNLSYRVPGVVDSLPDLKKAYRDDMKNLTQRGWFTERTRAVHVSFALYSPNYDLWTQNDYILEMPASGVAVPHKHVNVYQPSYKNTLNAVFLFWLDVVRLSLAMYVLIFQVCYEWGQSKKRGERVCTSYFLSPLGLADVGIGLIAILIFFLRQVYFGMMQDPITFLKDLMANPDGFRSTSEIAYLYRLQIQMEAPLFCMVLFRLLSFLRINRQVYMIWTTMAEAAKLYVPYALIAFPLLLGFVVWGHALWHTTERNFGSMQDSFMSVIMMVHGDIDVETMFTAHRPATLAFGVGLYVAVWLVLVNGWIAVLVKVYQEVRVRAGFQPSSYRWQEKEYATWFLWSIFHSLYFRVLRPNAEKPKKLQPTEDDDDDK